MTRYDYSYTNQYPMKRRRWPLVLGLAAVALVIAGCAFAYHATTGVPLIEPTTAPSAGAK